MPLTVVRSASNASLWQACVSRFLDELGHSSNPTEHAAHLWLTHRAQRDLLLEAAERREIPGWLSPPVSFFSELAGRFEIDGRPLGHLTGRLLLARIASRTAREHAFVEADAPGRSHMIDRTLSELLPEGVTPNELDTGLAALPGDEFTDRRNRWLSATYRGYLAEVERQGRFDPRSGHALIAARIRGGKLQRAIGGANRLHVLGPTSLRGRQRFFEALAAQREVDVQVYVPRDLDPGEWERLAHQVEDVRAPAPTAVDVQPAPDAIREAAWVARSIKTLLLDGSRQAHRIAVVARSGREDTRRVREALRRAGVPSTARLRSRLAEIPALRAVLALFDAAQDDWSWTTLRPVLKSPYFDVEVDLRGLEFVATRARPKGLKAWIEGLGGLLEESRSSRGWVVERAGVTAARLERDIPALERFAEAVAGLEETRTEAEWIELTRRVLRGEPLGMRDRVCPAVGERWDVVRLDQRGTLALDGLLREWRDLLSPRQEPLEAKDWHSRVLRVLESNEIALSTPLQRGVQVLEAHEAGLTPFEHVFIVHANDGVFPRLSTGGLFTDDERGTLTELGIPLATRGLRLEREQRLWRAGAGAERVTVSYWTADSNGVPRLPSLFVPTHERSHELPRTRRELPSNPELAVTRAELLESEVSRFVAMRGREDHSTFATPDPHAVRHAALAAFADELRSGGMDAFAEAGLSIHAVDPGLQTLVEEAAALFANERPLSERPHPWNGAIRDPVVLSVLGERFPETREWSASQLEQYGRRPFDFLLQRVLRLSESESADDEANRLTVGGLVHAILEQFYREADPADLAGSGLRPTAEAHFERTFDDLCDRYEQDERRWVGLPHVWAAQRGELRERLRAFLDWEMKQKDAAPPLAVELEFGQRAPMGTVDLSGPGRDGVARRLLLQGRIDRVDRIGSNGTDQLRVVDYKSGGAGSAPSPRAFDDAAALQGVLYMAAIEALGLGQAAVAVYRTVRAPANRGRRGPADIAPALELARQIPDRVRAGLFEAVQARSTALVDWQPGRDVTRTTSRLSSGTRFDLVSPASLPGAGAPP